MQVVLLLDYSEEEYLKLIVQFYSHIFCIPCSQSLRLSGSDSNRICLACETNLPNPDDAVSTVLNPTEDYKTSVLSGLSPSIIMEIASRSLSFWAYQSTQEMLVGSTYQREYEADFDKLQNLPTISFQVFTREIHQSQVSSRQDYARREFRDHVDA